VNDLLSRSTVLTLASVALLVVNLYGHTFFGLGVSPEKLGELAIILVFYIGGVTLASIGGYKLVLREGVESLSWVRSVDSKILAVILVVTGGGVWLQTIFNEESSNTIYLSFIFLALGALHSVGTRTRALHEARLDFFAARMPALISSMIALIIGISAIEILDFFWGIVIWKLLTPLFEVIWFSILDRNIHVSKLDKSRTQHYQKFSRPIWGSEFFVFVSSNLDYIILAYLLDLESLGLYWLLFQYGNYLLQIRKLFITFVTAFIVKYVIYALCVLNN